MAPSSEEQANTIAYFECEDGILTAWAAQDIKHLRERLEFVDENVFGRDFSGKSDSYKLEFDRPRSQAAKSIGVSEAELFALDQKVFQECGPYPEYEAKFPYGRKRIK